MRCRLVTLVVCFSLALAGSAYAQGAATTSTISGVVVDSAGGVVPGAEVTIKHNATSVTQSATSNAEGAYSFPSLPIGTYSVTVALQGFKTFVTNDVVITAGSPANIRAVLEVGGLEEQVLVSSRSEIVQTQSTVISSTINAIVVNERAIHAFIAEHGETYPTVHIALGEPKVVGAEAARRLAIPKQDRAFAHRGIIVQKRREP